MGYRCNRSVHDLSALVRYPVCGVAQPADSPSELAAAPSDQSGRRGAWVPGCLGALSNKRTGARARTDGDTRKLAHRWGQKPSCDKHQKKHWHPFTIGLTNSIPQGINTKQREHHGTLFRQHRSRINGAHRNGCTDHRRVTRINDILGDRDRICLGDHPR